MGGAHALQQEARENGVPEPRVIAHENLPARFARYERTNGYNAVINARQFAGTGRRVGTMGPATGRSFGPSTWIRPDLVFRERLRLRVGELEFELRHAKGETDDHLWAWVPAHRAICAGDFVTWVFPNAGNPRKVQRYPLEWAAALREMAALDAELLLPGHGLPIGGADRVRLSLDDMASALESLVEQTLALMNGGAPLDEILHGVRIAPELLEKPYLRPVYDEPEFVVRNIWRLYGGWYDGNPANLKPAPATAFAREVAALAGGATALASRSRTLAASDELRLACQLVELVAQAEPEDRAVHAARRDIHRLRRESELSLMARGIYGQAARQSAAVAGDEAE